MEGLAIRELAPGAPPPRELLLLADESEEMVQSYAGRGYAAVAELAGRIVGEYVLIDTRPKTMELVNVAVAEDMQGRGIGRALVMHAIAHARRRGCRTLDLGTGSTGVAQLGLYQSCGFRIVGVEPDFFVRHYPQPIVENGMRLRDMVRLVLELDR